MMLRILEPLNFHPLDFMTISGKVESFGIIQRATGRSGIELENSALMSHFRAVYNADRQQLGKKMLKRSLAPFF